MYANNQILLLYHITFKYNTGVVVTLIVINFTCRTPVYQVNAHYMNYVIKPIPMKT